MGWTAVRVVKNHMEWHRMPEMEENMTNQKGHGQGDILFCDRRAEEDHLAKCIEVIKANIAVYEEDVKRMNAEIKQMYDQYRDNDPEIFTELSNTITMNENMKTALSKNLRALKKPYFGRIDVVELDLSLIHI